MSLVNITNIIIQNNPAPFLTPFSMNISFECLQEIKGEIDWEFIYIGSAKNENHDQVLDSFSMGPLDPGSMQFNFQCDPPNWKKIPSKEDLLGVTAVILSVSYRK